MGRLIFEIPKLIHTTDPYFLLSQWHFICFCPVTNTIEFSSVMKDRSLWSYCNFHPVHFLSKILVSLGADPFDTPLCLFLPMGLLWVLHSVYFPVFASSGLAILDIRFLPAAVLALSEAGTSEIHRLSLLPEEWKQRITLRSEDEGCCWQYWPCHAGGFASILEDLCWI